MPREFMPILRHPEFRLPWALIAPHEKQAMKNHGQTLERLAERGGLCFTEAYATLRDLALFSIRHDDNAQVGAREWIERRIAAEIEYASWTVPDGVSLAHGETIPPSPTDGATP